MRTNSLLSVRISHVAVWTWDGNATITSSEVCADVVTSPTHAWRFFALVDIWNKLLYSLSFCATHKTAETFAKNKTFFAHLHMILNPLQVDSPRRMHNDMSREHFRKCPHRACTFCELHIRRRRRMFDCWRWVWSRGRNRTDSFPNSLCNDVGTSPDTQSTRPHPHISYCPLDHC